MLIGLLAALAAATLYAIGVALQSLDARHAHADDVMRAGLLLSLVQRPRWLLGGVISFAGWPLQALALAHAPLALVQPVLAFNLVVLLVIARRFTPDPVTRADVAGALAITAGVIALALAAPSRGRGSRHAHPRARRRPRRPLGAAAPPARAHAARGDAAARRSRRRVHAARDRDAARGRHGRRPTPARRRLLARGRRRRGLRGDGLRDERDAHPYGHPRRARRRSRSSRCCRSSSARWRSPSACPGRSARVSLLGAGLVVIVGGVALLGRAPALAELRHEPVVVGRLSGRLSPRAARPVAPDQRRRGRVVVELRLVGRLELRGDLARERLAELDAPLVERVDVPDRALREDAVLVEGDQAAERERRERSGEQRRRRAVALEDAVRDLRRRARPRPRPRRASGRTPAPRSARAGSRRAGRGAARAGSATCRSR